MEERRNGGAARRTGRGIRTAAALCLAALSFWTLRVTAGSTDAASAVQVLQEAALSPFAQGEKSAITALRNGGTLSPAAAIVLRQSPALYSARDRIAEFSENIPEQSTKEDMSELSGAADTPEISDDAESTENRKVWKTKPPKKRPCGRRR